MRDRMRGALLGAQQDFEQQERWAATAKIILASRDKAMTERQQARVDRLIREFHDPNVSSGYNSEDDHTSIEICVVSDNAQRAASEFRCCGFCVRVLAWEQLEQEVLSP